MKASNKRDNIHYSRQGNEIANKLTPNIMKRTDEIVVTVELDRARED